MDRSSSNTEAVYIEQTLEYESFPHHATILVIYINHIIPKLHFLPEPYTHTTSNYHILNYLQPLTSPHLTTIMINAVLVFNNSGQPRLTKFYTQLVPILSSPPRPEYTH